MVTSELLNKSLAQAKINISKDRGANVEKYINYYEGNTEQYTKGFFDSNFLAQTPVANNNLTRKFIEKESSIYKRDAVRSVGNESANKLYSELTRYKNVRMKHIERMTRLLGTLATQIVWDSNKGCLVYEPVYVFDIETSDDPLVPKAIMYQTREHVADAKKKSENGWVYFSGSEKVVFDANGKEKSYEAVEYGGVLPFLFTHRIDPMMDDFFVDGDKALISLNLDTNVGLTEINGGLRLGMFGQPWASGVRGGDNVRSGGDSTVHVPEGERFGIESPQSDFEGGLKAIKDRIELEAISRHLWMTWAETGGEVPSALSLMVKDLDRREDYEDDKERWRMYEEQMYEIEREIAGFNGKKLPPKLKVDFEEFEYPMTTQERIEIDRFYLEQNLTSRTAILMRDNRELTHEQAKRQLEKYKEENDAYKDQNQVQLQQLNGGVPEGGGQDAESVKKGDSGQDKGESKE